MPDFSKIDADFDDVGQSLGAVDSQLSQYGSTAEDQQRVNDFRALLEVTLAINASLDLDEVLELVMRKAIELMHAERGLVMLLDDQNELQVKAAYNLAKDELNDNDFRISGSVTSKVAASGQSIYSSDAQSDEETRGQKSIVELNIRSILCVPMTIKDTVTGVIYLDSRATATSKIFSKPDLYLLELYAQMVARAVENAKVYDSLRRMQRYLESVVSSSPVGIIVMDHAGRIATINTIALEILDLNKDRIRLLGRDLSPTRLQEVLPESQRSHWNTLINTVIATGSEFGDPRFYHNTGYLEKILSVKIAPIASLSTGDEGLIMTIEDATEKVTMEQYVILSEKLVARGEMAASVAHELNNYLAIISNNAELMNLNIEREKFDKVKFNSSSIIENVFKIKRFVDSLMDFSNPEPEYISYDIRRLIDDLLFSLRIQPRLKLVQFSIDMGGEIPNLEIDVGQVQQVLMNLLNNAADAIEERAIAANESGESYSREIGINVSYRPDADQILISVRDNGMGMLPETLEKVFNLHFTTKKGGHGLGLFNCRKIAKQHDGELTVMSERHVGTTFTLTLPRLHATPQPAQ